MDQIYVNQYEVNDSVVDRYGRLRPAAILFLAQDMAGCHCVQLELDYDKLAAKGLFWAVTRHRVRVTRLPRSGEIITLETWPMPTTRGAYPRALRATDETGQELFWVISLWVLMDIQSRAMVLPGKSGVEVEGILRGCELTAPLGLPARELVESTLRRVCFTDLDRNGHMNNTRYLDWVYDLLPSAFHESHSLEEMTVCYLAEGLEGQMLKLNWGCPEEKQVQVDIHREDAAGDHRIFATKLTFRKENP